jgi:hypothetical protein
MAGRPCPIQRVYDLNAFILQTLSMGESDTDTFFYEFIGREEKKTPRRRGKKEKEAKRAFRRNPVFKRNSLREHV